jgi:ADP-dependent NAD(P)H-hydrate dehydratase
VNTVDHQRLREWLAEDAGTANDAHGQVLIVGGSRQTPGAARLAAEAAMRAGAETVQVLTVRSTATAFAVGVPELLVEGVDETPDGEISASAFGLAAQMAEEADVVLVGPGFMSPRAAIELCRPLLPRLRTRVVLDALALAFLAAEPSFTFADGDAVLTPNTGEVALALGLDPSQLERETDGGARRLAHRANAVVSCGGSTTYVATPGGRMWEDSTGPGGLAASGSGDVKAGIVAAVFARMTDPEKAAVCGSHVHALAGERVATRVGDVGFLASEVVTAVPEVVASLTA